VTIDSKLGEENEVLVSIRAWPYDWSNQLVHVHYVYMLVIGKI